MRRPRLVDLATAAEVSLATVDRALNGRERVRPETLAHIMATARALGHPAALRFQPSPATTGSRRFGVVLHKQGHEFYRAFAEELRRAVRAEHSVQGELVLEFSPSQAPSEMAERLRRMHGRCDVLAATAVNHPEVSAAVTELRARGMTVYPLLSEFAPGQAAGYLGLDNYKHGRTAAWVLDKVTPGPGSLAVVVGGTRWHGHDLRDQGFRQYLRDNAPRLAVLDTIVNLETRQLTYETVSQLLARRGDLRGIYVAGGGMEGAIAAVRDAKAEGRVALVVSALTPESRRGLRSGLVTMVIDTPLEKLCRELIARMAGVAPGAPVANLAPLFLPPDIHVRESV